jgi:hypothetical protein
MAKFASTAVLDGTLDVISTATEEYVCNGQPATRAAAIAAAAHASAIALTSGDFTKSANGTGRQLTVAAKSITASAAQNNDHVAYCSASALLAVTTLPSVLTTTVGGTINVAAIAHQMPQPT